MAEAKNERLFFVLITQSTGRFFLGKVNENSLSNWTLKKSHLVVKDPKGLDIIPQPDETGTRIRGYTFQVSPAFPAKTKQERMVFDASSVEVLGEIVDDQCFEDAGGLYTPYKNMIDQWRNELSPIEVPTKAPVVNTSKMPNQPIPFPGNK